MLIVFRRAGKHYSQLGVFCSTRLIENDASSYSNPAYSLHSTRWDSAGWIMPCSLYGALHGILDAMLHEAMNYHLQQIK